MNIEDITIKQAREIAALFGMGNHQPIQLAHPYKVNGKYFIRTVTHHYTGILAEVHPQELVLTDAAWIADDGRLADALKSCEFNEVEPYPDGKVIIGRGAILDATEISTVPRSQK